MPTLANLTVSRRRLPSNLTVGPGFRDPGIYSAPRSDGSPIEPGSNAVDRP